MAYFLKVFALVALAVAPIFATDCAEGSCAAQEHDQTSLMQVKQVVKSSSERMESDKGAAEASLAHVENVVNSDSMWPYSSSAPKTLGGLPYPPKGGPVKAVRSYNGNIPPMGRTQAQRDKETKDATTHCTKTKLDVTGGGNVNLCELFFKTWASFSPTATGFVSVYGPFEIVFEALWGENLPVRLPKTMDKAYWCISETVDSDPVKMIVDQWRQGLLSVVTGQVMDPNAASGNINIGAGLGDLQVVADAVQSVVDNPSKWNGAALNKKFQEKLIKAKSKQSVHAYLGGTRPKYDAKCIEFWPQEDGKLYEYGGDKCQKRELTTSILAELAALMIAAKKSTYFDEEQIPGSKVEAAKKGVSKKGKKAALLQNGAGPPPLQEPEWDDEWTEDDCEEHDWTGEGPDGYSLKTVLPK